MDWISGSRRKCWLSSLCEENPARYTITMESSARTGFFRALSETDVKTSPGDDATASKYDVDECEILRPGRTVVLITVAGMLGAWGVTKPLSLTRDTLSVVRSGH